MLWAAATMCFFGFLRAGKVVIPGDHEFDPAIHLAHGDVTVDNVQDPKFIVVVVKASKTDPYRKGVRVYLGRAPGELCPVAAVLSYMVSRGSQPDPFFKFSDGRSLTRERFVVQRPWQRWATWVPTMLGTVSELVQRRRRQGRGCKTPLSRLWGGERVQHTPSTSGPDGSTVWSSEESGEPHTVKGFGTVGLDSLANRIIGGSLCYCGVGGDGTA